MRGRDLQRVASQFGQPADQPPQIVLMTPILEGLDGVQKMSKSLGNAIGINEPPSEMYGKLMSISDDLMWKYWTYLTDLKQSEVDALRAEVAAGALHPMEAKKRLARTIVADFHSPEETVRADENWAQMFQQKGVSEDLEEVSIAYADLVGPSGLPGALAIRLPKLLIALGLAASGAEASRKIAEKAVKLDGEVATNALIPLEKLPVQITVRLGKRAKVAAIS
jgi:tyrosyl-tRNA synthetase